MENKGRATNGAAALVLLAIAIPTPAYAVDSSTGSRSCVAGKHPVLVTVASSLSGSPATRHEWYSGSVLKVSNTGGANLTTHMQGFRSGSFIATTNTTFISVASSCANDPVL